LPRRWEKIGSVILQMTLIAVQHWVRNIENGSLMIEQLALAEFVKSL
jgi:hypothetical protein